MAQEIPTISSTFVPINNVEAPAVHLALGYQFNFSCLLYNDYKGTTNESCNQYITQPIETNDIDYPFVGNFSPKGAIKLAGYNTTEIEAEATSGPIFVYLYINITDPTYDDNNIAHEPFFRMTLYDAGKKKRNTITKRTLSYIGLPPTYLSEYYIESNMQSVPMESLNKTNIILRLSPRSFLLEEEQEQRHLTIISTLGTIAAYYSSIAFIYVFLFGVDSITPWGVIHGGCCGCRKVKHKTREVIYETVHSPDMEANLPDTEINLKTLIQKVNDLEKFKRYIGNNFIDTKLYE
ncbi:12959_t:CDS:2, partial [Ambispora leptoticha]